MNTNLVRTYCRIWFGLIAHIPTYLAGIPGLESLDKMTCRPLTSYPNGWLRILMYRYLVTSRAVVEAVKKDGRIMGKGFLRCRIFMFVLKFDLGEKLVLYLKCSKNRLGMFYEIFFTVTFFAAFKIQTSNNCLSSWIYHVPTNAWHYFPQLSGYPAVSSL